jgi:hypothetical protein
MCNFNQIKQAIDSQLSLKGLTKTDSDKADLYVAYQVAVNNETEWYATGYGGRFGFEGGFFFSSSMTTWMARSSCGSCPAMTSAGVCSTSMSGGTPSFSTTQPSSVQIARSGR